MGRWRSDTGGHLRITVRLADAVGGVSSPLVGIQVKFPESPGTRLEMRRVPSTMILTRDFRVLWGRGGGGGGRRGHMG